MSSTDPLELSAEIDAVPRDPPRPPGVEAWDFAGDVTFALASDASPSHSGQWICVKTPGALIDAGDAL